MLHVSWSGLRTCCENRMLNSMSLLPCFGTTKLWYTLTRIQYVMKGQGKGKTYIKSTEQLGDLFMKALSNVTFSYLMHNVFAPVKD